MLLPMPYWFPGIRKYKTYKDPVEQAKKRLKRDFDIRFNKKDRLYRYNGQEIDEQIAIEIVKEQGLSELKERLEG